MDISKYIPKINNMYNGLTKNDEFEIKFGYKSTSTISLNTFGIILQYITLRQNRDNLQSYTENSLDIAYNIVEDKSSINYRISINGIDNINNIIKTVCHRKNHVIYSIL